MKILAFAATSSKESINKQLLGYATRLIEGGLVSEASVKIIDLNDYEMPIYSIDKENDGGIPEAAHNFFNEIRDADAVLISFAEHNGSYTAAYKNIYDWASRISAKVYQSKPTVILATSPGGRGGAGVLQAAVDSAPHYGNELKASMSIPSFYTNFDADAGTLNNAELDQEFRTVLATITATGTNS